MKILTSALLGILTSSAIGAAITSHFDSDDSPKMMAGAVSVIATRNLSVLPIINDDFDRARAEANKRKLPLFIEVWAPW